MKLPWVSALLAVNGLAGAQSSPSALNATEINERTNCLQGVVNGTASTLYTPPIPPFTANATDAQLALDGVSACVFPQNTTAAQAFDTCISEPGGTISKAIDNPEILLDKNTVDGVASQFAGCVEAESPGGDVRTAQKNYASLFDDPALVLGNWGGGLLGNASTYITEQLHSAKQNSSSQISTTQSSASQTSSSKISAPTQQSRGERCVQLGYGAVVAVGGILLGR